MRRTLVVVCGLLLIVVGLVWGFGPNIEARSLPTTPSPLPVVTESSATESPPTAHPAVPATPALETPTPAAQPAEGAVPAWLSIPSIGVDESILSQGLTNGKVEPPPGQTIWYNGSSTPGQPGTSVIAGHVQWGPTPDNFWRLNEVPDGSLFTITYSDGTVTSWVTVNQTSESKDDLQNNQEVWGEGETPVVVLITCDKDSPVIGNHRTNNLVVFARPA